MSREDLSLGSMTLDLKRTNHLGLEQTNKQTKKKKKEKNRPTHNSMEFTPLIPLRIPLRVFRLAGTILAEILGGFGRDVGKEFHFDAAEGFAYGVV